MLPQLMKDGPSQTEMFYGLIKDFPVEEVLSFEKLRQISGFDIQGRHRSLVYRVNKLLLKQHNKMLKNIKNIGYKMATAEEQLKSANFRKVRAGRQVRKGRMEAIHLDNSSLTDEQKKQQMFLINHLSTMLSMSRKRKVVSLEETQEAKKRIIRAEKVQKEDLRELDKMQRQIINELAKQQRQLNSLVKDLT